MTPRPKHSTPELTEQNRQRLLEAAQDVFAIKGFDGANIREIASKAGLNKTMIYYHFKDKQTLFDMVVETIARPAFKHVFDAIKKDNSLEATIREVLEIYRSILSANNFRMRKMLARELAEGAPRIRKVIKALSPELIQAWAPKILADTGASNVPFEVMVHTVITMMTSIVSTYLTQPIFTSILEAADLDVAGPEYLNHVAQFVRGGVHNRLQPYIERTS